MVYFAREHRADPGNIRSVFAFAPALMFEASPDNLLREENRVSFFAGIGVQAYRFIGDGFDAFTRVALKLRPVGIRFNVGERTGNDVKRLAGPEGDRGVAGPAVFPHTHQLG